MTEEEWINSDLTVADLRRIYEDASVADYRRENAFWRCWNEYVSGLDGQIPRVGLEEMVSYGLWPVAAAAIIGNSARAGKLAAEDAAWILPYTTSHRSAADQVKALILLNDDSLTWGDKLARFLESRKDWAAAKVACALPSADWPEAETIIAASTYPRDAKRALSIIMKERANVSRPLK